MTHDGSVIAVRRFDGGETLELRDPFSGGAQPMGRSVKRPQEIISAAFSRDDAWLAIAERIDSLAPGSRITVLDAKTLKVEVELAGHEQDIHALAFRPDRERLASASFSGGQMDDSPGFSSNFNVARVKIWISRRLSSGRASPWTRQRST